MNREILFRGKRIDNGEWVTGDLLHPLNAKTSDMFIQPIGYGANKLACVDPDTVGQFTGKIDNITGRKVFEDDILSVHFKGECFSHIGSVKYSEGMFYVEIDTGKYTFMDLYVLDADIEVIGNVYDKLSEEK